MKKFIVVVLLVAAVLICKDIDNIQKINKIQGSLKAINSEIETNNKRLELLEEKIQPKNIDISLRAWFDDQIKNGSQVRGTDGKKPKER